MMEEFSPVYIIIYIRRDLFYHDLVHIIQGIHSIIGGVCVIIIINLIIAINSLKRSISSIILLSFLWKSSVW